MGVILHEPSRTELVKGVKMRIAWGWSTALKCRRAFSATFSMPRVMGSLEFQLPCLQVDERLLVSQGPPQSTHQALVTAFASVLEENPSLSPRHYSFIGLATLAKRARGPYSGKAGTYSPYSRKSRTQKGDVLD